MGRSNVGKSSLINKLLNRRHLARTSGQPGKTQTINFFLINDAFYLVDLPGYGYAKVSKDVRAAWGPMTLKYLQGRTMLRLASQLVDLRHPPSREDCAMNEWLFYQGIPHLVVATKADKVARSHLSKYHGVIHKDLKMADTGAEFVATSAGTGYGLDDLWQKVESRLFTPLTIS